VWVRLHREQKDPVRIRVTHVVPSIRQRQQAEVSLRYLEETTKGKDFVYNRQRVEIVHVKQSVADFIGFTLTNSAGRLQSGEAMEERARVLVFGGKRAAAEGLVALDRYLPQLISWYAAGGRAIFLADSLTPHAKEVFGGAAGVNFAGRGRAVRVDRARFPPDGHWAAITPTVCAPGWEGMAEVLATTAAGSYAVRGNGIAFVEACGGLSDDAQVPTLTQEEQEFLRWLVVELGMPPPELDDD
jgi:hypothetical protein